MFPKVCQVLVICMCIYIYIYIFTYDIYMWIHYFSWFPIVSPSYLGSLPIGFSPTAYLQIEPYQYVYIYICTVIYTYLLLTSYDIHKWYVHVYMVCISYYIYIYIHIYIYIYISFAYIYIYICACTHGISPCLNVLCVCVSENCLSIFQLHRSKAVAPKAKAKAGLRMEFPLSW